MLSASAMNLNVSPIPSPNVSVVKTKGSCDNQSGSPIADIGRVVTTGRGVAMEKYLSCRYCGRTSAMLYNLLTHERIHTNSRPYFCNVCGWSFGCSDHLRQHMSGHQTDKPFKCEVCGRAFSRKDCLRLHTYTHRKDQSYPHARARVTHRATKHAENSRRFMGLTDPMVVEVVNSEIVKLVPEDVAVQIEIFTDKF